MEPGRSSDACRAVTQTWPWARVLLLTVPWMGAVWFGAQGMHSLGCSFAPKSPHHSRTLAPSGPRMHAQAMLLCAVERIMLPQRQWFKLGKEKRWLSREQASTFCRVCTPAGPPVLRLRHAGRAILHISAGHSGTRLLSSRIKCIFRSLQILLLWSLHPTGVLFWKNSLRAVHGQLLSLCELNVMLCGV